MCGVVFGVCCAHCNISKVRLVRMLPEMRGVHVCVCCVLHVFCKVAAWAVYIYILYVDAKVGRKCSTFWSTKYVCLIMLRLYMFAFPNIVHCLEVRGGWGQEVRDEMNKHKIHNGLKMQTCRFRF